MDYIIDKILKYKKTVISIFALLVVFSILMTPMVRVNYDMVDYLPEDSKSTISLNLMQEQFDKSPSNVRVMLKNIDIVEVLKYKNLISEIDGVKEINWIDDSVNINQPLSMIDEELLNSYYKDDNALIDVVVDEGNGLQATIEKINSVVGDKGVVSGQAVTLAYAQSSTSEEVSKIIMFIIPLIILILMISTSSWFEPVLFLLTVGISILINMGTNIFLGEISFITQSTSAILQLAVSMDYAIFLLHKFADFREEGLDIKDAMANAMKKSFSSIFASGLTTILGFLALTLMRFKVGPDLGIVLAKGIVFSLASVMLLLPVITIYTYKIIDKTHHKSFMPSFNKFSKFSMKIGPVVLIVVALSVVPSYLAQSKNHFTYGASSMASDDESDVGKAIIETDNIFGKSNQLVFMIPANDAAGEKEIVDKLYEINGVSNVISYSNMVGNEIPKGFVPSEDLSSLVSDKYSRMIITLSADEESKIAFDAIESIRNLGYEYFGEDCYLAGNSASAYDIKETVTSDNVITTIGSIIAIGLVIMFTYKSLALPIILLFAIESSIWINLSYTYFSAGSIAYIGYMVISAVQLGATVDYAILFANSYLENRKLFNKYNSAINTLKSSTGTVLTSASIMCISGFALGIISSNSVIAQLGILMGRGAALSATLVLFFLPTVFILCDKLIEKTTIKSNFFKGINNKEFEERNNNEYVCGE